MTANKQQKGRTPRPVWPKFETNPYTGEAWEKKAPLTGPLRNYRVPVAVETEDGHRVQVLTVRTREVLNQRALAKLYGFTAVDVGAL
ncbi:MAG: hypothetical protein QM729_21280 [Solirubrobacterales bacterium]